MSEATTGVPAANASVSTIPKLSPPSEGAQSTSAQAQLGRLLRLGDLAQRVHAAVIEQQRRDLLGGCPHERERGGHVLAQRLEGAQQHGQPLALDGLADEQDAQRPPPCTHRESGGHRPVAVRTQSASVSAPSLDESRPPSIGKPSPRAPPNAKPSPRPLATGSPAAGRCTPLGTIR